MCFYIISFTTRVAIKGVTVYNCYDGNDDNVVSQLFSNIQYTVAVNG